MKFTAEEIAFRDSIRRMVQRHVAPIAAEIDENDRFPMELVPIYGDMGLLQLWVPEEYGGPGGNLTMVCIAREEISKVSESCGLLAGETTMFVLPIMHFGTDAQKKALASADCRGTDDDRRGPFRARRRLGCGRNAHTCSTRRRFIPSHGIEAVGFVR